MKPRKGQDPAAEALEALPMNLLRAEVGARRQAASAAQRAYVRALKVWRRRKRAACQPPWRELWL